MADMTFVPPELESKFRSALGLISDYADVEIFDQNVQPDFEVADFEDTTVELATELQFNLVRSESVTITVGDLIGIADEFQSRSASCDGLTYYSATRLILGLTAGDPKTIRFVEALDEGPKHHFDVALNVDGANVTVGVTKGSIAFAVGVVKTDLFYDKYYPPYEGEAPFIEVMYDKALPRDTAQDLAYAYLFELGSTLDVRFTLTPRAEEMDYPAEESGEGHTTARLRPLLVGPGLAPLLREYQSALAAHDESNAILGFTKCIEYVSASVVRSRQYEDIRRRLLSPAAIDPSAPFIDDLLALVEEHRQFMKDHEALRITVERCCDPQLLAEYAPKQVASLNELRKDAKASERKAALTALAGCLSATRNQIAHAKANYDLTGQECPVEQLPELARCAQIAAEQCIRWYGDLSPTLRRR